MNIMKRDVPFNENMSLLELIINEAVIFDKIALLVPSLAFYGATKEEIS